MKIQLSAKFIKALALIIQTSVLPNSKSIFHIIHQEDLNGDKYLSFTITKTNEGKSKLHFAFKNSNLEREVFIGLFSAEQTNLIEDLISQINMVSKESYFPTYCEELFGCTVGFVFEEKLNNQNWVAITNSTNNPVILNLEKESQPIDFSYQLNNLTKPPFEAPYYFKDVTAKTNGELEIKGYKDI